MEKTFKSSVVVMTLTQFKLFLVFTTSFVCWALIFWMFFMAILGVYLQMRSLGIYNLTTSIMSTTQLSAGDIEMLLKLSWVEKSINKSRTYFFLMSFLIFPISNWKSLIYAIAKFNLYFRSPLGQTDLHCGSVSLEFELTDALRGPVNTPILKIHLQYPSNFLLYRWLWQQVSSFIVAQHDNTEKRVKLFSQHRIK